MSHRKPRYIRPARRAARTPGPRFVASLDFVETFPSIWGYAPRCHGCRRLIQPGEAIRWVVAGRPGSIYHEACLPPNAPQAKAA